VHREYHRSWYLHVLTLRAWQDDEPIVEYEEDEPVVSTTTLDTDIDTIYCYTVGNASAKRSRSEEEEEIESVIVPTKKTRK
jgi:hypothetical protein